MWQSTHSQYSTQQTLLIARFAYIDMRKCRIVDTTLDTTFWFRWHGPVPVQRLFTTSPLDQRQTLSVLSTSGRAAKWAGGGQAGRAVGPVARWGIGRRTGGRVSGQEADRQAEGQLGRWIGSWAGGQASIGSRASGQAAGQARPVGGPVGGVEVPNTRTLKASWCRTRSNLG